MYAGKRYNGNPISTKRYKLYGVGPVDNRPYINKKGGPKKLHIGIDLRVYLV